MIYDEFCTPGLGYRQSNFRDCKCADPAEDAAGCSEVVTGRFDQWGGIDPDSGQLYSYDIVELTFSGPCQGGSGAQAGSAHVRRYERGVLVVDRHEVASIGSAFDRCFGVADGFGVLGNPPQCPTEPGSTLFWSNERTCGSVKFSLRQGAIGALGIKIEVQVTRSNARTAPVCEGECGGSTRAFRNEPALLSLLQG